MINHHSLVGLEINGAMIFIYYEINNEIQRGNHF